MYGTRNPEVVIGVDFGMTFTGVAYSMAPGWGPPRAIQHWPGILGSALASKVPTAISYDHGANMDTAWGFCCEGEQDTHIEELFKLYLDPEYCDSNPNAPTYQEACRWFTDYMRHLHTYLQAFFSRSFPRWNSRCVEFLFSVPTTWKNPAMISRLEQLIREAGFGERDSHSVRISLTEAEAAAVWVAKQNYEKDDVCLICDAGGGTTDVNILKILSNSTTTELVQLGSVEGAIIGSSMIDFKMQRLIESRLQPIKHLIPGEIDVVAEQMLKGRFDTFKCSFGTAASKLDKLPLFVPGLDASQNFPQSSIQDGKMVVTRAELQHIFDGLVKKMFDLVDAQLEKLQITHSMENIVKSILKIITCSPYVQEQLKERYERGRGKNFSNTHNLKVLLAPEPQLAVCNGLVANRAQEIATDHMIYRTRCCRVSYGILCREKYDPHKHVGEDITVDSRDGQYWVENQIDWIVKEGEEILAEAGVMRHYRLKLELGKENQPWRGQIVMSTLPARQLSRSLKHSGATKVCRIEASLRREDMQRKNSRWYNLSREYWLADFDIKVLIGPADLRFQLVGAGGAIRSIGDESSITVQWESPQRGSASYVCS